MLTSNFKQGQLSGDILSESLQEFLSSLRQQTFFQPTQSIPHLEFCTINEDILARDSLSGFPRMHVIDGHSEKINLLYILLATCIMPSEYLSTFIGGWGKAAFILDMDGHFRVSRFREILFTRLQEKLPSLAVPSITDHYLHRLHVFRPRSSEHLAITLKYLLFHQSRLFPDVELGIIAVHAIDAFYWFDRFKAELIRSVSVKRSRPYITKLHNPLSSTLVMTRGMRSKLNPIANTIESKVSNELGINLKSTMPDAGLAFPSTTEFSRNQKIIFTILKSEQRQ
ncbi:hypothetical protein BDN70DRAFT_39426 [Pholiota conissans]|uniref:Uncharacterized protein n=1 Tax=Pholiota conissans TaxID=109636 RepID=A0A9P5YZA3_9AGAR|nr:hypothetical protein BDN70DRAFT_39426 [Pholiota conissans]